MCLLNFLPTASLSVDLWSFFSIFGANMTELAQVLKELRTMRSDMEADKIEVMEKLEEIGALKTSVETLRSQVATLEQENLTMREDIRAVRLQCNLNEQFSKSANLLFFGIPFSGDESPVDTERIIRELFTQTKVTSRLVSVQRMNRKNIQSPIIVTFENKLHAQEVFHHIRKIPHSTFNEARRHEVTKIEVRFHLSKHLTHLLRTASLLKRELRWSMCRPRSDTQSVELRKEPNSESIDIYSIEELITLKNQMIENKQLNPSSPAAAISVVARGIRRRAESRTTYEANTTRNPKKPNQKK